MLIKYKISQLFFILQTFRNELVELLIRKSKLNNLTRNDLQKLVMILTIVVKS